MPSRFKSRWANHAARIAITLAALGLFLTLRPDIYGSWKNTAYSDYHRKVTSPRIIAEYFRTHTDRRLQIGAGGNNPEGWLNTDIDPTPQQAYVDATQPLPFPDGSFQYVFGEHVIEHITYEQGLAFLREVYRVLTPGGKIRMVTPDLAVYLALFTELDPEHSPRTAAYVRRKLEAQDWPHSPDPAAVILNHQMRWFGHQFLYTPTLLRASFAAAGFTQIRQYAAGESDDVVLRAADFGPSTPYHDVNQFEAMAIEGTR